jgi:hypothetical protein
MPWDSPAYSGVTVASRDGSYVAVSGKTVTDLISLENRCAEIDLHEGVLGLVGSSAVLNGAATMVVESINDALNALDVGLDNFIKAVESSRISSPGAVLQVFSLVIRRAEVISEIQILSISNDAMLKEWFERCTVETVASASLVERGEGGGISATKWGDLFYW